jgi:PIN domain nuclease of toxin-antitoxin system
MSSFVFDASTVLVSINKELGYEPVDAIVESDDVIISSVNLAEVVTKLVLKGSADSQIDAALAPYRLSIIPFSQVGATRAGLLAARTRHRGLSLADRACLALAMELGLPVVTADRSWADLDLGIDIRLIR